MSDELARTIATQLGAAPTEAARWALMEACELVGWQAEAAALLRLLVQGGLADAAALARLGRLAAAIPAPTPAALPAAEAAVRAAPPELREASWRGVLAAFPGNVAAHMELGHALRGAGDPAAALPHFAAARRGAPEAAWAIMAEADTLRQLGRGAEAEAGYRDLLARQPEHVPALAGLAECRRQQGDAKEARRLFRRLRDAAPESPAGPLGLAELDLAAGDANAAAAGFRQALALAPGHHGGLMGLGHAAMALGDPIAARRYFGTVAAALPGAAWARLALAEAERAAGAPAVAVPHYRAVLAAMPDSLPARLGLIAALRDAGQAAAALTEARAASAAAPREPALLLALGLAARAAGDHEAAVDAFEAAAALRPDDPQPLVEASSARRALGDPAAALALLQRALAIAPAHVPALEHLAGHHRIAGDLDAARAGFEAAIATGRPGPWSYLGAAEIHAEQGRLAAALALLEAGTQALPASAALPAKRLDLMRRCGAVPEALAAARALPADRFAIWFERVMLEHQAGDAAMAAELLAAPPSAANLAERARTLHLRGLMQADRWELEAAEALLSEAASLAVDDLWPRARLTMLHLARCDAAAARASLAEQVRIDAAAASLQGRVNRASQSFHGQLLDDLALEPALLAELAGLAVRPAAERLAPLLAMVRRAPDHFGTAYALAVALRQSGGFGFRPDPAAPPIPNRIAQYWNAAELPDDLDSFMASWRGAGLAQTRFDDASAAAWLQATLPPAVHAAWRRLREKTQRADLLRLAVLAREGGWWADADDRLFGDLAALAPPGASLVLYQEDLGSIGNNLIGALPGHPVVVAALEQAVESINRGDADMIWLQTGPGLLTRMLAGAVADAGAVPPGILVHDHLAALHQVAMHCLAEYKTRHHWMRPKARTQPSAAAAGRRPAPCEDAARMPGG